MRVKIVKIWSRSPTKLATIAQVRQAASNLFAMALFTVLVVFAVVLVPRGEHDATTDRALFPGLADRVNEVRSIRIRNASDSVTVIQRDHQWRVEERHYYPADEALVRGLLLDLAQARVLEELTANPELHHTLGVADISQPDSRAIQVELMDADGRNLAGVVLGDGKRETEGYARISGHHQALLVAPLPGVRPSPVSWLDRTLLDVKRSDIALVEINDVEGERIVLEAGEAGVMSLSNQPPGTSVRYRFALNDFATTLAGLQFKDVRPADTLEFTGSFSGRVTTRGGLVAVFESALTDDALWLRFHAATSDDPSEQAAIHAGGLNERWATWAYRLHDTALARLTRPMGELIETDTTTDAIAPDS